MLKARLNCVLSVKNFIEIIFRLMKVTGAYTCQRALATWYPVQCDPGRVRKSWRDQKAGVTYKIFGLINTYDLRQHPLE